MYLKVLNELNLKKNLLDYAHHLKAEQLHLHR